MDSWTPVQVHGQGNVGFLELGACAEDQDGAGYVSQDDCDDDDAEINPGATEACDFVDGDCDQLIDEGFDVDGDSHETCDGDCDDADACIHPGAVELPGDDVDQDCDGSDPCPCNGSGNHGSCVQCVAQGAEALVASGAITEAEKDCLVGLAGASTCGRLGGGSPPDYASCFNGCP